MVAIHFFMDGKLEVPVEHFVAKIVDQLGKGGELAGGGAVLLKISDEADPDSVLVVEVAADVTAIDLAAPSWADLDLSIAGVDPVSDDKVVGEAILHSASTMVTVIGFGVSVADCAVVGDDVFPAAIFRVDFPGCLPDGIEIGAFPGDKEAITGPDEVGFQAVLALEFANGHAVIFRDFTKGIPPPNGVDLFGAKPQTETRAAQ